MIHYAERGSRREVLVEQFGYLLVHAIPCQLPDCPDCARFHSMEEVLMAPWALNDLEQQIELARAA